MANFNEEIDIQTGDEDEGLQFDWRDYYYAILNRIWIVILCGVAGGALGFAALQKLPVLYAARSVLFIEQSGQNVLKGMESVKEDQIRSIDMVNTTIETLSSEPFLLRVVARNNLATVPGIVPAATPEQKLEDGAVASYLRGCLSVRLREETRLIDITVTHGNPEVPSLVANAVAEEFIRFGLEQRSEAARSANMFLLEEAEQLRQKLRRAEEALQSFKERENAASLESMQSLVAGKLNGLNAEISALNEELSSLQRDLETVKTMEGKVEDLMSIPSVLGHPAVAALNQQVTAAEDSFTLVKQRYKFKHPRYKEHAARIATLAGRRDEVAREAVRGLQARKQELSERLARLNADLKIQEERSLEVSKKAIEYNSLNRDAETERAMYNSVVGRIKEIDLTEGLQASPVRVFERSQGVGQVATQKAKVVLTYLLGALAAGIGIALLLHFMDQSVKTVDQAERILRLPVIAAVPRTKSILEKGLMVTEKKGVITEAFRGFRTTVVLHDREALKKVILITSALPSEGKTFCSANLAGILAQQGSKILLIDCDMRKPKVSSTFFGENRIPGLSDVLAGDSTFEEAIIASGHENLDVITAGSRTDLASEQLSGDGLKALLEHASENYDKVIVDTPPVNVVSDTLLIAPLVDAIYMVVRAEKTPRGAARRACKALTEIDCTPSGIVVNSLPVRHGNYYYSYRYYGHYGKNAYGQEKA